MPVAMVEDSGFSGTASSLTDVVPSGADEWEQVGLG